MINQLVDINPSAKAPLFRRLMADEDLAYLREDKSIIGFELDLTKEQTLSGFTLVGIQKHTIYAYRSDLQEEPRLVLFPPLDKLFDGTFEMLDLRVIKKEFTSATFEGKTIDTGVFSDLVKDLTPPEKEVDIPDGVSEQMVEQMKRIQTKKEIPLSKPVESAPSDIEVEAPQEEIMEEHDELNNFDDYNDFEEGYDNFDSYEEPHDDYYEEPEPEPLPEPEPEPEKPSEDPRSTELKIQEFKTLVEVGDYVYLRLGVPKQISDQIVNRALQSDVVQQGKVKSIDLAIMLFCKLFNDKKV